ncbi:metallo-dependent phosphatase-like protein [Brevundimonas phage vB_BpoS-Gurke]|uniref:Metallo-dependent phosphatase-like protein n=1 Tax=Brevundimonas phage vB_BpoS-Gurke TaxID=2948599 RepID=A0A9E7N3L7_9CAUD|nr:metallo-dependent phosphatase-like protein [Brevundimonas phage vB_BpoS-Gurke]
MRINILSDLHLEFGGMGRDYTPAPCDVLVLAGDAATGVVGVIWADRHFPGVPVVYVPGNHEFYGKRRIKRHIEKMKAKAVELGSSVHVLDDEALVIDGVRFLGATLWTDFNLYGTQYLSMMAARRGMTDYRQIETEPMRLLTPEAVLSLHTRSVFFLREQLRLSHDGPTVVVTHHAPSERSSHPRYRGSELNPCYASRLEPLILEYEPDLWVHGHMHDSSDYQIGKTRVLTNPRGYIGHELNPNFDPNLIVEIG